LNDKKIKEIKCEPEAKIEMFSDSTFFSDIRCMQYADGIIYALDVKRSQIIAFDDNLVNVATIGGAGQGPEELTVPFRFYVCNDTVYVIDSGSGGIKSFYQSVFSGFLRLTCAVDKRFFYRNNKFYLPCITDNTSVSVVGLDSTYNVGEVFQFNTKKEIYLRNERNVLLSDSSFFYTTSDNMPVIEKYDLNTFKLIDRFDLSEIPLIKKNLTFIASKPKEENSYWTLFDDSYSANNSIYLLCATLGDGFKVNRLIEVSLCPEMKVRRSFTLPGIIYGSFCVSGDYIFAFNESDGFIERFKLPMYE
jgi:hypothetical protein